MQYMSFAVILLSAALGVLALRSRTDFGNVMYADDNANRDLNNASDWWAKQLEKAEAPPKRKQPQRVLLPPR